MATYPGDNDGIAPPDLESEVGVVRILLGDADYEEYDPAVPGRGNYEMFSDQDIEGFLAASQGGVNRAMGYAYMALAGQAAKESKLVKDFDLTVDLTKRAGELRLIAQGWFQQADQDDAANLDAFEVAPLADSCERVPEGVMPRWGRHAVGGWEC